MWQKQSYPVFLGALRVKCFEPTKTFNTEDTEEHRVKTGTFP